MPGMKVYKDKTHSRQITMFAMQNAGSILLSAKVYLQYVKCTRGKHKGEVKIHLDGI